MSLPSTSAPIVEAHALGWFLSDQARWLWRGIDFAIYSHDRFSLSGPSGSGKTLFLRSLALLSPVTEGSVSWNGKPIAPQAVPGFRSRVSYLSQRAMLVDGTVRDNLLLPYQFQSHSRLISDEAFWFDSLREMGRDDAFLDRRSDELSGGEAQIVALIRVLQLRPEVLLLDEPTSAMDPKSAEAAESLIMSTCGETGTGYLWITHDERQATRVGPRRFHLQNGKLEEEFA